MAKGHIVLAEFPYDDFKKSKLRPGLCLTENISEYEHIVIAFITSNIHKPLLESDLLLLMDSAGFEDTGLHVDSKIQLHKLITVSKKKIIRNLGVLPEKYFPVIKAKLDKIFG